MARAITHDSWKPSSLEDYDDGITHIDSDLQFEQWRAATSDFLSKVASIIGHRTVPFEWYDPNFHPNGDIAFTDGETIFVNPKYFLDSVGEYIKRRNFAGASGAIATLKGAAYHELAHIMYTPRLSGRPVSDIRTMMTNGASPDLFKAWNILEDQRIESLFVARYRPAAEYFKGMAAKFLLVGLTNPNDRVARAMVYPMIYGRKYLPNGIRDLARAELVQYLVNVAYFKDADADALASEMEQVIDQFKTTVYPTDGLTAVSLTERFEQLLRKISGNWAAAAPEAGGEHGAKVGRAEPVSVQRAEVDAMIESESDDGSDDGNDGVGSGTGDDDSDADGEGDDNGGKGTGDDKDGEGDSSGGASGVSRGGSNDLKSAIEAMQQAAAAATERDVRSKNISDINKTRVKTMRSAKPDLSGAVDEPVSPAMKNGSSKIINAILALRADGEEVWTKQNPSGRLNVRQVMQARGQNLNVFDRFVDVGDDATSFEVVILLDQSSSMGGFCQIEASQAMWVIRSAFQHLDIPVTVIGYDSQTRLLFRPTDKVGRMTYERVAVNGSTEPEPALEWALSIFQTSQAANKLLFSITDGQWYDGLRLKTLVNKIKSTGAHTTLVQQGSPAGYWGAASPGSKFHFDSNAQRHHNYYHERLIRVGNSAAELPAALAKAIGAMTRVAIHGH